MKQGYIGTAPALERGLAIIEIISVHDEPLSFTRLEQLTSIPKATLNRLLKVLCGMNYLAKSPAGKYMRGAQCGLVGRPDNIQAAMHQYGPEIVRQVCQYTNNTCILFYWNGKHTQVAAKEMHEMSLSMQTIGNISTDYIKTPWGWIFLECPELSPELKDIPKPSAEHYSFYAKNGFMLDIQENTCRLAVPVTSGTETVGALGLGVSISSPKTQLIKEYGSILKKHAKILSLKLSQSKG